MAVPQIVDRPWGSVVAEPTNRAYSATISARLAGISYRQIDHWERMDVLKPSIQEAHGSGKSRRYSTDDVMVLAVLGELTRLGAPLHNLRIAESVIRDALHGEPRWLLVTPEDLAETCPDGMITVCLAMHGVTGAWIIDIKAVTDRLEL